MLVGNYYFTKLQCTKTRSTLYNLGTNSLFLSLSMLLLVLPNNFMVSFDNNSNLYPDFILKAILLFISFT